MTAWREIGSERASSVAAGGVRRERPHEPVADKRRQPRSRADPPDDEQRSRSRAAALLGGEMQQKRPQFRPGAEARGLRRRPLLIIA